MRKASEEAATSPESRVTDAYEAPANRYPYTVSIMSPTTMMHFCGGSLVAPDLVLTAAQCQSDGSLIRTNPYQLNNPAPGSELFLACDSVSLQNTLGWPWFPGDYLRSFDFQLIKINGTSSQPWVRLNTDPNTPIPEITEMTMLGWGENSQEYLGLYGPHEQLLQQGNVTETELSLCEYLLSSTLRDETDDRVFESLICGFGQARLCTGDEGNPLVLRGSPDDPDLDVLVGIGSHQWICGSRKSIGHD